MIICNKILFAEDKPQDRIPVADYLRAKEFDVIELFNPTQVKIILDELKKNGTKDILIIILDLVMPEGYPDGGKDVLEHMEKLKINDIPVIICSAYGYNGPAKELKEKHNFVKKILTKTYDPKDVYHAIQEITAIRSSKKTIEKKSP